MLEQLISNHKKELISKLNQLIIGQRKGYIEQYKKDKTVQYWTSPYKLTDSVIAAHLRGKRTIGCFYLGKYTKFFCVDIDEKNIDILQTLVTAIESVGISNKDIHIELSGLKGWHIWLFFDEPILITDAVIFGKYIINQLQEGKTKIELRPENENKSRGIKLPFAVHKKQGVRTTFLSDEFTELKDPVQYFLHINPMSSAAFLEKVEKIKETLPKGSKVIKKAEQEFLPLREHFCTGYSLARKLIQKGMKEVEMTDLKRRHYYQFFVALYYKSLGYTEKQTQEKVSEWALTEMEKGRSNSNREEIIEDVHRDVAYIYCKDKKFYNRGTSTLIVCKQDISLLEKYDDTATKKVIWCILLLGRIFHEKGQFFFSLRQVAKMTGCSKNTVDRRLKVLMEDGFIAKINNGSYISGKASIYFVPQLVRPMKVSYQLEPTANTFKQLFDETFEQIQTETKS